MATWFIYHNINVTKKDHSIKVTPALQFQGERVYTWIIRLATYCFSFLFTLCTCSHCLVKWNYVQKYKVICWINEWIMSVANITTAFMQHTFGGRHHDIVIHRHVSTSDTYVPAAHQSQHWTTCCTACVLCTTSVYQTNTDTCINAPGDRNHSFESSSDFFSHRSWGGSLFSLSW